MSDARNQWRCPYCDGLNRWEDEVCQICGDGKRPETTTAEPEMPKFYTPPERRDPSSKEPETPPPLRYAPPDPEPPKKKRHGLLWAIVIAALAYGGGKLLGGQAGQFISGALKPRQSSAIVDIATPEPQAFPDWTAVPTQAATSAPTPTPSPTPTPRPTAAPTPEPPTLKKGDSGDEVASLQYDLVEHNYLADMADGQFGGKTEAAVKRVQADAGLQQTGVADGPTRAYLRDHSASFTPAKDSDILMFYADYDRASGNFTIVFKNLGKKTVKCVDLMIDQRNESKAALGSFVGERNIKRQTFWTTHQRDLVMGSGMTDSAIVTLKDGSEMTLKNGGSRTVVIFDNARYAKITLQSFTTDDGVEHKASQKLYCRID